MLIVQSSDTPRVSDVSSQEPAGGPVVSAPIAFDPIAMVDASAYGVSADNVDNAANIRFAETAALQAGKDLWFDPGTYEVGSLISLQSNEHWIATPGTVTLQAANGVGRLLGIGGHPGAGSADPAVFTTNDSLTGLTFRGAESGMEPSRSLITTWYASNIHLTDCTIKDVSALGIILSDTRNTTISNCAFSNIGNAPGDDGKLGAASQGIAFCGDPGLSTGNSVVDSTFTGIGLDAVSATDQTGFTAEGNRMSTLNVMSGWDTQGQGAAGFYIANDHNTTISGNQIEGASGNGIDAYRDDTLSITDNISTNNYEAGIALWDVTSTQVVGNTSTDNNQLDNHFPHTAGISIGGDTVMPDAGITVTDNILADDQASPTQDWGIQLDAGSSISDLNISADNLLYGNRDGASVGLAGSSAAGLTASSTIPSQFQISSTDQSLAAIVQPLVTSAVAGLRPGALVNSGRSSPTILGSGGSLLICPNATGLLDLGNAYSSVLIDQSAAVTLAGNAGAVVGDGFSFSGGASTVISASGMSDIEDSRAGAVVTIGSRASAQVISDGIDQTVSIGAAAIATLSLNAGATSICAADGSQTLLRIAGGSNSLQLGSSASTTLIAAGSVANATRGFSQDSGAGSESNVTGSVVSLGVADTVTAIGGTYAAVATGSDVVNNLSSNLNLVANGAASTVYGGSGDTTVQASGAAVFYAGTNNASSDGNVFLGGSASSTILAGSGGGIFFSGSGGSLFEIGTSASQCFVGRGGADTISASGNATSATIYASGSEHMLLTAATPQVTVVALAGEPARAGGSAIIDLSVTAGGDVIYAGFGATGNETLMGSTRLLDSSGAPVGDRYVLGSATEGDFTNTGDPANITIENWHFGDTLQLVGFSQSDELAMQQSISSAGAAGSHGRMFVTLSDRSVVTFVGLHPTGFDTTRSLAY